jgi:hypothetical protein
MRASSDPTPMNHSNKDTRPSAESGEGRLLIEKNTFPSRTFPTQSGVCTCLSRVGECADEITERTRPLLSEVGRLDFLGHVPQQ